MGTQVWSDQGAQDDLTVYLRTGGQGLDGYKVMLFKQNLTVDKNLTIAQLLTAEATFPGYARLVLSYNQWPAVTVTNHVASSTYAQQLSWTCTGGGTAETEYGYAVIDPSATKWVFADKFVTAGYQMLNNGDNIAGSLTLTSQSHN